VNLPYRGEFIICSLGDFLLEKWYTFREYRNVCHHILCSLTTLSFIILYIVSIDFCVHKVDCVYLYCQHDYIVPDLACADNIVARNATNVCLSTATPSVGGAIPELGTCKLTFQLPDIQLNTLSYANKSGGFGFSRSGSVSKKRKRYV